MKLLFDIPLIEVELEEKRRETEKQNKTLHLDTAMFLFSDFALVIDFSYVTIRFYVNMIMKKEWSLPTWLTTLQTWLR